MPLRHNSLQILVDYGHIGRASEWQNLGRRRFSRGNTSEQAHRVAVKCPAKLSQFRGSLFDRRDVDGVDGVAL